MADSPLLLLFLLLQLSYGPTMLLVGLQEVRNSWEGTLRGPCVPSVVLMLIPITQPVLCRGCGGL